MSTSDRYFDIDFLARFLVGAAAGAALGGAVFYLTGWGRWYLIVGVPALAFALLSALFDEDFWSFLWQFMWGWW